MADVPELHLVPNRCGIWSNSVDKKGCGGAIWTNLEKAQRSAEETKPIPAVHDEKASAASAHPSTSGRFPLFKRVKSTMYSHWAKRYPKLPKHRRDLQILVPFRITKAGEEFLLWQSASRHILVFATGSNIRLLAAMRTWGMVGFIFQALLNKAAVLGVNLNPESIICDFETALIPVIQGYFPNTRVQGCYFHFCQAVHRKVGELGLKTRYRQHEETRRKIRMLLATAFLPVPHVNTGVSLLEAGTMEPITTWMEGWHNRLNRKAAKSHNGLYELLQILIAEQGVMDTLIQQVLSGNVTVGDLRRVNRVYAQKQRRVAQYTGEYTNGRRTLEQFLEALMYITPEPI
ncbi:hypothetical protein T01_6089 [Trichinella spiralis]|uniref:Uncharacterized protein n=2 Tax=Trichinella spiralis TaxID=6334 RepID=A0A0V1C167_TRISP|nr:hypothetical protein T01_6089 [Trichinella spiralis]